MPMFAHGKAIDKQVLGAPPNFVAYSLLHNITLFYNLLYCLRLPDTAHMNQEFFMAIDHKSWIAKIVDHDCKQPFQTKNFSCQSCHDFVTEMFLVVYIRITEIRKKNYLNSRFLHQDMQEVSNRSLDFLVWIFQHVCHSDNGTVVCPST